MESVEHGGIESMEDVFLQDNHGPTIAEHAAQCRSLFHKYLIMPEILENPTIMDDQSARFNLWTSNMGVWGPPNVSLDYRLRFSPAATDIIHELLDVICDTLLSLKPIGDSPPHVTNRKGQRISGQNSSEVMRRSDNDTSDSVSDVDPEEENDLKVTETIGGTITWLVRLSNTVRRSAKANWARKIASYNDEDANKAIDELRLYTRCYIEFRFPEAPEALRSALVEANAWRLRRIHYQWSHRPRIDISMQSPPTTLPTTGPVVQFSNTTGTSPAVRFAPSPLPKPEMNNDLSFPPMPRNGQCIYCGATIEFEETESSRPWQDHVIRDLKPFICVFSQCQGGGHHGETGPLTFETSNAWSNHMQTAHADYIWVCRAPSHKLIVFEQETDYQEHVVTEHEVPKARAGTFSRGARRPDLDKVLKCPFGDDFQPPDKIETSAVFSSKALQSHVAGHMIDIALLALQKIPSHNDDNAKNINH
ncbi:hypothetical protein GGR57DRAFT_519631 [Xylariaceae sp. FL1272]|nr:hypothetical protein GGR57DRAFT_519631 [Xylariaceae sp. FL1272]